MADQPKNDSDKTPPASPPPPVAQAQPPKPNPKADIAPKAVHFSEDSQPIRMVRKKDKPEGTNG